MRIPLLKIKILLESNPLKSRILYGDGPFVSRLAQVWKDRPATGRRCKENAAAAMGNGESSVRAPAARELPTMLSRNDCIL